MIECLKTQDVSMLRELNQLFGRAFDDADSYGGNPPSDDYLNDFLAKEQNIVLVALHQKTVIGGLVAYALDKFEMARREYYIYDLAVGEQYRRQGVATALIGRLCELAGSNGGWVVYVQADESDPPAIALYRKLGKGEKVLHFDIPVSFRHLHNRQ
ncbi:AAC(3)-I family aminoglycoside N-acetyltransferase [Advenella kashmirensis]|uniref:AAC(3)-I family aminoglycoside N-acetyltransferase n=1 Tax=Advenella kashmirensis TaxID=310575 RepID=UPI0004CE04EB